ncbi:MAG: hypothetical protein ABI614_29615, partial [Planctomycetota bacterium]
MIVKDLWRSLIFCCIAQSLLAGHARAEADELVSMIAALRSEFRPVTVDDIEAAKLEVRNTLFEINGWLGYGQHARAWHDYLIWDEQMEGFQSRDVVDADVWQRVYYRVARDTDLLDADVF